MGKTRNGRDTASRTQLKHELHDTLKDHALKLVANAHSEMSEKQWSDYVDELTNTYSEALTERVNRYVLQHLKALPRQAHDIQAVRTYTCVPSRALNAMIKELGEVGSATSPPTNNKPNEAEVK